MMSDIVLGKEKGNGRSKKKKKKSKDVASLSPLFLLLERSFLMYVMSLLLLTLVSLLLHSLLACLALTEFLYSSPSHPSKRS